MLIFALLVMRLSANYAAIFAIVVLLAVGCGKTMITEKRLPFKEIYDALIRATKTTIPVAMACACAGVVIGIVSMTGIGVKFTRIVFELSGGNLILMLAMIMLACIVMGMGLPATAAYVIAATIGVPPLIEAGITPLAANMFVFYFAIVSFITPPVALAAYAASGIADSNSMKTGFQAFILGLSGFIIPYIYVYNPALLIVETGTAETLYITFLTTVAVTLMAIATSGWLKGSIPVTIRILLLISTILIFIPGMMFINLIGLVSGIIICVITILLNKKSLANTQEVNHA